VESAPKPVVPTYTRIESGAAKILLGDPIFMGDAGFHLYLRELCGALGYKQRPIMGAEENGTDFVLERDGKTVVMRVEVNTGSVGPGEEAVQKVLEAQARYAADEAVVATNRFFEDDAWEAARHSGVELWDILGLRRRRNAVLASAG
jgi:HJR/Mrr/RecB family endonuclease